MSTTVVPPDAKTNPPISAVPTAQTGNLTVGFTAAFFTLLLWAGFLLISRFGLRADMAALDLAALRFGVGFLVTAPIMFMVGMAGLSLTRCLVIGTAAGLGFPLMAYHGFQLAPAAHAAVLMPGCLPLFTVLFGALIGLERIGPIRWLGLGGIALGAALLLVASGGAGAPGQWLGDLLFLGGAASWAVYTVAAKAWKVPPLNGVAVIGVFSALVYVPIYALFVFDGLPPVPTEMLVIQGLYHGVVATVLALFTFATAVRHIGAANATMILSFTPALATVAAIPVLGEVPDPLSWVGLALVTLGLITAVLATRRERG